MGGWLDHQRDCQWRGEGKRGLGAPFLTGWGGVGTLTCLGNEAECGQGQEGEERKGLHGVSQSLRSVCCWDSAGLFPSASSTIYTLWAVPWRPGWGRLVMVRVGHRGICQSYLGVIRPRSIGQTPKDVVVGAGAA